MFPLKLLFVLGVLTVSLSTVVAVSIEEMQKMEQAIMPYILDCIPEFGVTEEDFEKANKEKTWDAFDSCLIKCIYKKIKLINDKGLLDFDVAEEVSKKYLSDDADQKKALDVINKCKAVNERDVTDGEKGCERAGFFLECILGFKDIFNQ